MKPLAGSENDNPNKKTNCKVKKLTVLERTSKSTIYNLIFADTQGDKRNEQERNNQ